MKSKVMLAVIMSLAFTILTAHAEEPGHEDKHGHEHHAPHGGTLVVFGDEFAHMELLLDPETGELKVYILDGEAEKPVRISEEQILIKVSPKEAKGEGAEQTELLLALKPVSNVLTGEKEGDTSEFTVQSDELKNASEFKAEIKEIEIRGVKFKEVEFGYPEGNE